MLRSPKWWSCVLNLMGLLSILLPHIMHRQTSLGGIIMHWMLKIPPSTKWLYTNNLVMDWGCGNIQTGKLLGELVYYTVFAYGPKGYSTSRVWYKERSETHCFYKELQRGEVRARDISWLLSGVLILVRSPIKGKGQNVIKWECWIWEREVPSAFTAHSGWDLPQNPHPCHSQKPYWCFLPVSQVLLAMMQNLLLLPSP